MLGLLAELLKIHHMTISWLKSADQWRFNKKVERSASVTGSYQSTQRRQSERFEKEAEHRVVLSLVCRPICYSREIKNVVCVKRNKTRKWAKAFEILCVLFISALQGLSREILPGDMRPIPSPLVSEVIVETRIACLYNRLIQWFSNFFKKITQRSSSNF